jgi:hypothetical protein
LNYRDISGATVLLLLRNHEAKDWPSLCRAFQLHPRMTTRTEHYKLRTVLTNLRSAGLIEFDPASLELEVGEQSGTRRITVSKNWSQIQGALEISLSKVARLSSRNSMMVDPFFGLPNKKKAKSTDVFVLMPFQERLKPIYDDHIKVVTDKLAVSVSRADDLFGADAVMSDIWTSICAAKVIVADCTDRNPNVFYEIR